MNTTTYRALHLTGKGGLDRLVEVDLPLVDPGPGELRVTVRATGAGSTDITMRTAYYPYRPDFPFVPGYEVVGEVDAVGAGVTGFRVGQRVAALTVYGGYAERMVRSADDFVPVPDGLDDAEVVALILNYVTAYQMVHREAKLRAGQSALVTGANGGVGTALLELLRLIDVRALGAASPKHHDYVRSLGGEPVASRTVALDVATRAVLPDGVDAAFDGMSGSGTGECVRALKRGGIVVGYGFMGTSPGGSPSLLAVMRGYGSLFVGAPLTGRRGAFYGITALYRKDKRPFREDLATLFGLLASRSITPRIAARLPLLAAREAQAMLEAGGVAGKIVHLRG